jgi:toxin ParE1/3/4
MRVILKRPRAADDLIELWDYIAEDSVTRADAFIDDVDAKFQTARHDPFDLVGPGRRKRSIKNGSAPMSTHYCRREVPAIQRACRDGAFIAGLTP